MGIATETADAQATLTIANSGPVIAGDQLQRLLQPFERLSREGNSHADGYGLGLAIAHAVIRGHGATIATDARSDGGLSIQVTFAAATEASAAPAIN